jgi:hypothetical protein
MYVGSPAAGTHTYKMTMLRAVGTGTITNNAGVGFPSFILVEDISATWFSGPAIANPTPYYINAAAGSANTTSSVFIDYPGSITKSITKGLAATSLLVSGAIGVYKGTAGLTVLALLINGVDYPIAQFFGNALSTHTTIPIAVAIAAGLAPGTYSAKVRWKTDGSQSLTDGNDIVYLVITEGVPG